MNKKALIITSSLAIASNAIAGEDYSKKSVVPVQEPQPECLYKWFAGASIGSLTDKNEGLITGHVGIERRCPDTPYIHALYLEVGHTEFRESTNLPTIAPSLSQEIDVEIVPITLNYKFEGPVTQKLSWYLGAGVGIALINMDTQGIFFFSSSSFDDTVFYAHACAGVIYNFTPSFKAFLGARYIYMDDPDLSGISSIDSRANLYGDVLIELGLRYSF